MIAWQFTLQGETRPSHAYRFLGRGAEGWGRKVIVITRILLFRKTKLLQLKNPSPWTVILWSVRTLRDWEPRHSPATYQELNKHLLKKKRLAKEKKSVHPFYSNFSPRWGTNKSTWIKCVPFTIPNNFTNLQIAMIKPHIVSEFQPLQSGLKSVTKGPN